MAQNIYDQQHFFDNYARLPRSVHGLSGAPEWAELRAMLPSLQGKDVVDLGCGYGWFCRYAVEHGAESVSGLDLSRKMLERAQVLTNSEAITYQCCDLEQLSLPAQSFDLAYSSLALHYLRDINRFFDCLSQAVRPDGWLVVSMEHPVYTCPERQEWGVDSMGKRSWMVNQYQEEGERVSNWLADGVRKHHRTLGTILNAVIHAGFDLRHVREWGPDDAQIAEQPALAEEAKRPMLLLFSAQKR